MLTVKLGSCVDCINVKDTLCQIDEKLYFYGSNQLNNIKLLTCLDFNQENLDLLITYKRILGNRIFNPSYCCEFDLATIISRVKVLLNK